VILANHRIVPPYGMDGGGEAALGRNWVERTDGTIETLTATDIRKMGVGDVFVIETPGGGGLAKVTSSQNNRFCNQTAHDERRFDGTRKV